MPGHRRPRELNAVAARVVRSRSIEDNDTGARRSGSVGFLTPSGEAGASIG